MSANGAGGDFVVTIAADTSALRSGLDAATRLLARLRPARRRRRLRLRLLRFLAAVAYRGYLVAVGATTLVVRLSTQVVTGCRIVSYWAYRVHRRCDSAAVREARREWFEA